MRTGMAAAAALSHHQGPDHHTNDGLDRPVPVLAQDQNHIFVALLHLSATHGQQPDLAINRHPGCYLGRQRERLAGEYVNFDTILNEVTTNKAGVPMAAKVSVFGSESRHVRDISSWLQAWFAYAATVLLVDPAQGYKKIGYQSIVAKASSEYQTSEWLKYDRAFCYFAVQDGT